MSFQNNQQHSNSLGSAGDEDGSQDVYITSPTTDNNQLNPTGSAFAGRVTPDSSPGKKRHSVLAEIAGSENKYRVGDATPPHAVNISPPHSPALNKISSGAFENSSSGSYSPGQKRKGLAAAAALTGVQFLADSSPVSPGGKKRSGGADGDLSGAFASGSLGFRSSPENSGFVLDPRADAMLPPALRSKELDDVSPERQQSEQPAHQQIDMNKSKLRDNAWRPSLRFIIAVACGIVILIVAVVTLVLTTVVANSTVRDLGEQLSKSFVISARNKAEAYFEAPVQQLAAVSRMLKDDGVMLPSDNPDLSVEKFCPTFRSVLYAGGMIAPTLGVFWADGNTFGTLPYLEYGMVGCGLRNNFNASNNGGFVTNDVSFFYLANDSRVPPEYMPTDSSIQANVVDSRSTAYYGMAPIASRSKDVFALSVVAYTTSDRGTALSVPFFTGVYNSSQNFLGILALSLPSTELKTFFAEIERTPNSNIIAVDGSGTIIASTYSVPAAEVYTQSVSLPVPQGCLTTNDVLPSSNPGIVCPATTTSYPYPPLNKLAAQPNAATFLVPTQLQFQTMKVNGEEYFIVSSPIPNSANRFVMSILFFLPTDDILSEIKSGRNLTIIIAVCIFVVAVLLSVFMVFRLLRPLNQILMIMSAAAKLDIDTAVGDSQSTAAGSDTTAAPNAQHDPHKNLSSISEIFELQLAMRNMTTALVAFTRYLPVELVKDIAESGTLCKIGMLPVEATSLFVDIAGFTSISERVPASDLSLCMTIFYEQMTQCLTKTSGQMITLLGDGIFAIFNAPNLVMNHELKGALCALMMSRETVVDPIAGAFDDVGETLNLRLGVNTGITNVGNQGCSSRLMWTAVSNAVNVASRLEGLNKAFGTRVMISDDVAQKCRHLLLLRFLMPVQVVGKEEVLRVFETVGIMPNIHIDTVLPKSEESIANMSKQLLSLSNSKSFSMSGQTGGGSDQHATLVVSKRKNANRSAHDILTKICAYDEASLIVSNTEIAFVQHFNRCAELFAEEQAQACLEGLQQLRKQFPNFFQGDNLEPLKHQIRNENETVTGGGSGSGGASGGSSSGGHPVPLPPRLSHRRGSLLHTPSHDAAVFRCEAGLIRGELSVQRMEKMCRAALGMKPVDSENNSVSSGSSTNYSRPNPLEESKKPSFVFKADQK